MWCLVSGGCRVVDGGRWPPWRQRARGHAEPLGLRTGMAWWHGQRGQAAGGSGEGGAAVCGSCSTDGCPLRTGHDPVTSRARQREQAQALARGHGVIVAEFFDVGESRTVTWGRRPEAAALVAQLGDPGRGVGRDRDRGVRAGVLR